MAGRKQNNKNKKAKQSNNKAYWLYGKHAVMSALGSDKRQIEQLVATKNAAANMPKTRIDVEIIDPKALDKILPQDAVHQGIAALVHPLPSIHLGDLLEINKVIILDQVSDPHNIGAILRSAAAFGFQAVIVQDKNSPQEGAVMSKTASGALEVVPLVRVTNISDAMAELKDSGFWCIGMDGKAKSLIKDAAQYDKVAVVMGAEGNGLRTLVEKNCDLLVKLPISGVIESLNVSNAAAIAMYELGE